MNREELVAVVKEKGVDWAVASIVEGSIGYHSPSSAKMRIKQLLEGKYVFGCERTYACFDGDSLKELEHDFKCFVYLEEVNPEKVKRIISLMKVISGLKDMEQTVFGFAYPTLNI